MISLVISEVSTSFKSFVIIRFTSLLHFKIYIITISRIPKLYILEIVFDIFDFYFRDIGRQEENEVRGTLQLVDEELDVAILENE